MQYQIFIKNPPEKSALRKTFLPCKIKNEKCTQNYEAATKASSPKAAVSKLNNKTIKILEKHPQKSSLSPERQTYWK